MHGRGMDLHVSELLRRNLVHGRCGPAEQDATYLDLRRAGFRDEDAREMIRARVRYLNMKPNAANGGRRLTADQ